MNEIFIGFLSKTLNMDTDRLAELLYKKTDDGTLTDQLSDSALTSLLDADATRVKALRDGADGKGAFDNGYKKGQKEAMENFERSLRTEYKTESTAQGPDLVKHIVAAAAKSKASDDDVKLHPMFLKLEQEAKAQVEAAKAEAEQQIGQLKSGYERKERFGTAQQRIMEAFDSLRPVLPSDPARAARVRQEFAERFANYDYDIQADGSIVVKNAEGKRVETPQGYPVNLTDLVKMEAEARFDFAKQEPKGNAGNTGNTPGQGAAPVPKNQDEYIAAMANASTDAEAIAIQNAFQAAQ